MDVMKATEQAPTASQAPVPLGSSLDCAAFSELHFRFWLLAALGVNARRLRLLHHRGGQPTAHQGLRPLDLRGGTYALRIEPKGRSLNELS
jgi:hypothetical protein